MNLPWRIVLRAVVVVGVSVATSIWPLCADEAVDGPTLMQRVRDDIAWGGKLESLHLMARIEERRTPEGIEHSLKQIKEQNPDLDQPDPLKFTELLPETNLRLELDFDARRFRWMWLFRDSNNRELSRETQFWDGRRVVSHSQNLRQQTDSVTFSPDIGPASYSIWGWTSYLNHQPLECWWNEPPALREQLHSRFASAADFTLVDRENYHGVDCHVLVETRNDFRDRYYIGVQDGRWYGAKIGVISFANLPMFAETHQRLVEKFLGRSLGTNPSDEVWNAVHREFITMPSARRAEWGKRLYSELGKQFTPCWEFWFSDFRDLSEGRFFPFRETHLSYEHDKADKKIFLANQRTLFVRKLTLNQPLDDSLFDEPIAAGAEVVDETAKAQ